MSKLEIIAEIEPRIAPCGQRMRMVRVRCDCGTVFSALLNNIRRDHTQSCGCLKYQLPSYHGMRGTPIYTSWDSMIQRCTNPKSYHYRNYGARGIMICSEWRNFKNFHKWAIENGWAEGLEIDRINNDGNYEPSNCRWVTPAVNNLNKRTNRLLTFDGQTKTLKEWSDLTGLRYKTIQGRIDIMKWSVEKALTTPPKQSIGTQRYAHLFREVRS